MSPVKSVYVTGTTAATVIAAAGEGLRIEVLKISASCSTAAATLTFADGTISGGTVKQVMIPDHTVATIEGYDGGPLWTGTANTLVEAAASAGTFYARIWYRVI